MKTKRLVGKIALTSRLVATGCCCSCSCGNCFIC